MTNNIGDKVKDIMKRAIQEARGYDDSELKPEHILMSLIVDEDNKVVHILRELNVDTIKLFDTLSLFLTANNFKANKIYSNNEEIELRPSVGTNYIVNQMDAECTQAGLSIIDETHLMLGILKSKTQAQQLLLKFKINYSRFKNENMADKTPDGFDEGPIRPRKSKKLTKDSSKTPALDNFCRNITEAATKGELDPVVGRKKEIRRVTQILSRRKKNNPVLIGEPGVGKTAIVEGLATLIYEGEAPRPLADKKIFSLDLASAVAGTKYRGQFEERMKQILEELKANPDIILFIDELHTLVGAGNASGSLDASNIFKPAQQP
jgi:ATP-dependent Clp protease ATP-binding subunit ClpC